MKDIIELLRQAMKQAEFYVGLVLWTFAHLLLEVGKWRKNTIDSGVASMDEYFWVNLLHLVAAFFLCTSFLLILKIWYELRKSFTSYHPSLWQFGLSATWMSIKVMAIITIILIPLFGYTARNYVDAMLNPLRYLLTVFGILILCSPFLFTLVYGGNALIVTRGHSRRCVRDSFRAISYVWREALLILGLTFLPGLLLLRLLSFKFPALEIVAMAFNVCLSPIAFAIIATSWMMIGKRLIEKAPALVAKGNLAAISVDP